MTIRNIIKKIYRQLHGLYNEREIESFVRIIFEYYLNMQPAELHLSDAEVADAEDKRIMDAIEKLGQNVPVQYVVGETEFYGLRLEVTPDVLIPRPETEELVEWIVKSYNRSDALSIADIGAGSGCIAIALKTHFANADVWAIDVSEAALSVARRNAANNGADIHFRRCDALKDGMMCFERGTLDVIVSNPPYITQQERSMLAPNVIEHEPHLALFAPDADAFIFIRHIAAFARQSLKPNGKLFLEINEACPYEAVTILKQHNFSDITPRKDINGKWRMLSGTLGTRMCTGLLENGFFE